MFREQGHYVIMHGDIGKKRIYEYKQYVSRSIQVMQLYMKGDELPGSIPFHPALPVFLRIIPHNRANYRFVMFPGYEKGKTTTITKTLR